VTVIEKTLAVLEWTLRPGEQRGQLPSCPFGYPLIPKVRNKTRKSACIHPCPVSWR